MACNEHRTASGVSSITCEAQPKCLRNAGKLPSFCQPKWHTNDRILLYVTSSPEDNNQIDQWNSHVYINKLYTALFLFFIVSIWSSNYANCQVIVSYGDADITSRDRVEFATRYTYCKGIFDLWQPITHICIFSVRITYDFNFNVCNKKELCDLEPLHAMLHYVTHWISIRKKYIYIYIYVDIYGFIILSAVGTS